MSASEFIDSLQFAKSGASRSGELGAEQLPRLHEILAPDYAAVQYQLLGCVSAGRPSLHMKVRARVQQVCQRCLENFTAEIEVDESLVLARDEAELERWEEQDPMLDVVVAEPRMNVAALIEDEVLLALPVAPRHPEGSCGVGNLN